MTKRTRYFMLGSAAVLVTGLCTGLIAYYGGLPAGPFSPAAGVEEMKYVPADAAVVAYADVREVMSSELRRRFEELSPDRDKGRQEFERETGIDIENDVDRVLASVVSLEGNGQGVALIRGRFNDVQIESFGRSHGATVETYGGARILSKREGDREAALAFLEPGLLAVGELSAVKRAIETAAGAANITSNSEMMKLMDEMGASNNAWAVGRFDALASRARLPDNLAGQIPSIQWFAAGGRVNGGVSGVVRAEARDDQAAANLRDVVKGFLALAKLQTSSKPELQGMLDSLELSGTGKTVALSFSIPSQALEAIVPKSKAQD